MGIFIVTLIVAVIAGILIWNFKHLIDWESGSLEGHLRSFDLGETRPVTYQAVSKNKRVLTNLAITAELKVREVVYYNQGTDRRRASSELYSAPISLERQPDDTAVVLSGLLDIPGDLPPSLDLSNNNVIWTVEILLDPSQGTQLEDSFELTVVPRVRAQGAEPDFVDRAGMDDGSSFLPPTPRDIYEE